MPKNLTNLSDVELVDIRAAADAAMNEQRDIKAAVRDEISRRETVALLERLTDPERDLLTQHLTGVGGIESQNVVAGIK